jgi:uncharacterized protein (TIGR02466 family)
MKDTIYEIFPTAIYKTNINRSLSIQERKIIDINYKKLNNNFGNKTSKNTNILEEKFLKNIKNFILKSLNKYYRNVLKVKNCKPFITNSWLNFTGKNQWHHQHNHSNSYVSGVLYLNVVKEIDHIVFHKNDYLMFNFNTLENSPYNTNIWKINVDNGDLVLFPSNLQHDVPFREHDSIRISLAFNSYFKGTVGKDFKLNKLTI